MSIIIVMMEVSDETTQSNDISPQQECIYKKIILGFQNKWFETYDWLHYT